MDYKKSTVVAKRKRFDNWIKTYHHLVNASDVLNGVVLDKKRSQSNLYLTLLKMSENQKYLPEYRFAEIRRWIRKFDKKCNLPDSENVIKYLNQKITQC